MQDRSRSRIVLKVLVAAVALGVPAVVACGGRVAGEGGGSGSNNGTGAAPTSSSTASTGASSQPTSAPLCDSNGFSTSSGASCAVSFSKSLFPNLIGPNGSARCADSNCHGPTTPGGTGVNQPTIDGSTAAKAYASLVQYGGVDGEAYVNACSTNPKESAILCNIAGSCQPQMPTTGAGVTDAHIDDQQLKDLKTWLACGAPLN